ncbi:uncharacterized protein EV154DRAFT_444357 [Mucor mucedo]|uniref:uncharacterized protein n=1 Tax=Mucor mucedo TaxID=29922 RepID=UPI0022212ACF|nr:uncharacterized protein EV154DRAFT_444357 [Mucor mucedo]KAI7890633.1 hypothetical protein EV154DRAFT_444357 [Mucor mucedo]
MNFEDIVDMDWVDTHTTLEDTTDFSSEYFFDHQPDFLLEQPLTPPLQASTIEPEIKMEPISSMPTTEQIKQLIEIAKRQLALREQHYLQQQEQQPSLFQPIIDTPAVVNETTAAPSNIFSMPPLPILSPTTVATTDGIDLKRLTPKERRQLRNKLSARNFRVRRKEYISTLEGQVNDHKMAAEALKDKLVKVEEENKKLRKEMDNLKRQNQILLSQKSSSSPRILSSSLPKPNLNKDISIMGTKATDSYRQQDNCILVSNAIMPVWDYNAILSNQHKKIEQQQQQQQQPKNEYMDLLVGQFLLSVVQLASCMPRGTNQIQDDDYRLPLMPDDRDFSSSSTTIKSTNSSLSISNNFLASTSSSFPTLINSPPLSSSYMEDLYDVLIQSALINSSNSDKSFWWWDNSNSQAM